MVGWLVGGAIKDWLWVKAEKRKRVKVEVQDPETGEWQTI
jgi:hypothetical protein